ncbi:AmmeMemoRadiSam system protein A [candidate division CSSED10-310 bacterium]|uniref:AmmeMemoRadiSam system protein A n=1 Tax=candidate division CSSED10-310 bacterium TaxID=2855610 RepID=A0ABV6YY63_UNCC1
MVDFTQNEKDDLLALARDAIDTKLKGKTVAVAEQLSEALQTAAGVFVTLHKKGKLRGCIGTFQADFPLYKQVIKMAQASAFEDIRFSSVRLSELKDIDIEISVLSPLREIESIAEIVIGKHGIYITQGFHRGVLLPQVATDHGWDRETFLQHTCMKAGLPMDAWQKGTKIEIFSATILGEKD